MIIPGPQPAGKPAPAGSPGNKQTPRQVPPKNKPAAPASAESSEQGPIKQGPTKQRPTKQPIARTAASRASESQSGDAQPSKQVRPAATDKPNQPSPPKSPPPLPKKRPAAKPRPPQAAPRPPVEHRSVPPTPPERAAAVHSHMAAEMGEPNAAASTASNEPADQAEPAHGVTHPPEQVWTVYYLAMGLAALGLVSMAPAALEVIDYFRPHENNVSIQRWAHLLLWLGVVQFAYALLLAQLPDWSTTWVAMVFTAVLATLYAGGLGVSVMAAPDNQVIAMLGLSEYLRDASGSTWGPLPGWCFIMLVLTGLMTYFLTRVTLRWHHDYQKLAMAGSPG